MAFSTLLTEGLKTTTSFSSEAGLVSFWTLVIRVSLATALPKFHIRKASLEYKHLNNHVIVISTVDSL